MALPVRITIMAKTKGTLDFSEGENPPPAGKKYLLGIGINNYAHCPQLHNAVRDVEDIAALMHEKFGFDPEPPYTQILRDEEATAHGIMLAFKRLIREVTPSDTVLVYFSGHGEFDPDLEVGYWVTVDVQRDAQTQYLSNDIIQRFLQRINSFHTLLLVDSCYSGSLFLDGKGKFVSDSYDFPSRWGLVSGRNTIVSDGRLGENSPFATALLDTLRRLDQPMNVGALCDIVKQYVPAATQKRQTPIGDPLSMEGHKGGQLVFVPQTKSLDPDAAAWATAEAENTAIAYSRYLRQFPRGRFTEKVEATLERLEREANRVEDTYWAEAQSKNTLLAYHRYLRQYPEGRYNAEANRRLEALEQEAEMQKRLTEEVPTKKNEQEAAEQKRKAVEEHQRREATRPQNGTVLQDAPNLPKHGVCERRDF